jgi:hypothetical protein
MGHANPETTAGHVHLSPETLAADLSAQFGHSQRVVDASMRRFITAEESICPNWVQLSVLAVVPRCGATL